MQSSTRHLNDTKKSKVQENRKSIIRFFSYIGKRKVSYWFFIMLAVGGNALLTVLIAYLNRILFQSVQFGNYELFKRACFVSAIILIFSFFYPFTRYFHIKVVRVMIYELKLKMFHHLNELDQSYMDSHHSGDVIQRIGIDAEDLKTAYFTQVYALCNLVFCGLTALISMLFYQVELTCYSVVCCAITVYLSTQMNKKIKRMSTDIQKRIAKLTEKISNVISGFLIIKLFEGSGKIIEDFDSSNEDVTLETMKRTKKLSELQMTTFLTGMLGSLGSVLFGALLVYQGKADFGIVMAVVSLQINISQTMQYFGVMLARFHGSMAKADRVYDFLETQAAEVKTLSCVQEPVLEESEKVPEKTSKQASEKVFKKAPEKASDKASVHETKKSCSAICFENVTFAYPGCEPVLKNFDLSVSENEKVVVAGPSGKGKSTLIKILLGLYPYQSGTVSLLGHNVADLDQKMLREQIAYVPQNSQLFEGTIMENIRMAKPHATKEQVIRAAKLSYADEFIEQLPQKYDTPLVMGGMNLSGGQRQRIALARALVKDAPILLLDEITSALDTESEEKIMKAINQINNKKTILMITHRIQTAGGFDKLIEI